MKAGGGKSLFPDDRPQLKHLSAADGPIRGIVGLDLDNTIIRYDRLFHDLAASEGLIPAGFPALKTDIRDYLRSRGGEKDWQRLQALAYGPLISKAAVFPGALETIAAFSEQGLTTVIVSHKSRRSAYGGFDLRAAAGYFLQSQKITDLIGDIYFLDSLDEKVRVVCQLDCLVFVDDLAEVFSSPHFPQTTHGIHFQPEGAGDGGGLRACSSWSEIKEAVLELVR